MPLVGRHFIPTLCLPSALHLSSLRSSGPQVVAAVVVLIVVAGFHPGSCPAPPIWILPVIALHRQPRPSLLDTPLPPLPALPLRLARPRRLAMAKPVAEISDDWQEVDDDDNFSIVSLPTDDGQNDPFTNPRPADAAPAEPSRTLTLPIRGPKSDQTWPPPDYDDVPAADAKNTLPAPPTAASTWSASSSDRSVNEILDVDLDPTFLQKVTASLIKLIGEVLGTINFAGNFDQPQGAYGIRVPCYTLRDHLKSLEPIMVGYAKHWDPDEAAAVALPLDPGLYEWMSNLRIELLGLQDILQRHMANNLGAGAPDKRTTGSRLDKYRDSLAGFAAEMENFLPIIQEDFNEFHAANLPAEASDSTASGAHHETLFGPGRDAAIARQLRDNRMNALESGKPQVIATANIGCQTHLASAGRTPVRHWIELIDAALGTPESH